MSNKVRLAVAGVGNNISALVQGVHYYRAAAADEEMALLGIRSPLIGSLSPSDVDFVAAFDVSAGKVGQDLSAAIFAPPNNYPRLDVTLPRLGVTVRAAPELDGVPQHLRADFTPQGDESSSAEQVVQVLKESGAEVLLYSLPTGCSQAAAFYAKCALEAGAAFVNCTPEEVARNPEILAAFKRKGIPLLGDDLASHLGSSVVHKTLLCLLAERGLTLRSSYQINFGGNTDFKNLLVSGKSKATSKKNALRAENVDLDLIDVVPSGGYIPTLRDNKVAILNIEGVGWGGMPVTIDLKLKVQDSSNAAGVIIDLIRIAAVAKRESVGGFISSAADILKSPPNVAKPRVAPVATASTAEERHARGPE